MKKESIIIFVILIAFVIFIVPKLIEIFNNDNKVDNNTTTTNISNDRFVIETKRMILNTQQQYMGNFGEWNYYALDGSKDNNLNIITTKECTSTSGIDVPIDSNGNIKEYCRIYNNSEIILKSFIVTFDESSGEIKTVYSFDGIHLYKFDSSVDGVFDFANIK